MEQQIAPRPDSELADIERFIELVPAPVTVLTKSGMSLSVNRAYCEVLGLSREEVKTRTLDDAIHPEDVDCAAEVIERALGDGQGKAELRLRHKDGHFLTLEWDLLFDAGMGRIMAIAQDRTVYKARLADALQQASTDALTGALSRSGMSDRLTALLKDHPLGGVLVAMIDLDRFKEINDSYGHLAGDRVLTVISQRLHSNVEQPSQVARVGGDEFVVFAPPSHHTMAHFGDSIGTVFVDPVVLSDHAHPVSGSVGVCSSRPGDSIVEVLHRSDLAAYHAKRRGRNQVCLAGRDAPDERRHPLIT